ncbi:hypothetical protein RKD19_000609 [Streptomyces canus]
MHVEGVRLDGGLRVPAGQVAGDLPVGGCLSAVQETRGSEDKRLADLAQRVRDGRLRVRVGAVRPPAEAVDVFTSRLRVPGRTIIRVAEN